MRLIILIALVLGLTGCSPLARPPMGSKPPDNPDTGAPVDPSMWPAFNGEWDFIPIDPSQAEAGYELRIYLCQKGPSLWGSDGADTGLAGVIRLDGFFMFQADFFIGAGIMWVIWGNVNDQEKKFEGYVSHWGGHPPIGLSAPWPGAFSSALFHGRRIGPVNRVVSECPEGMEG